MLSDYKSKIFRATRIFLALILAIAICNSGQSLAAQKSSLPNGIQSLAPRGTVPNNVSFRIVFKNPVVQKSSTKKTIATSDNLFPFTVKPAIQAEGKWVNEHTFTAQLLAPLKNATQYEATFRPGLKDRKGVKISGKFNFQTESLATTDISASIGSDGRAYFDMDFNMRVDPARLKGYLSIHDATGRAVDYRINGSLPGKNIRLSIPVNDSSANRQTFTVKIAAGMRSSEGDLGFDQEFSKRVVLDPDFHVQSLNGEEKQIRAYFNFDVDPNSAKSFIKIEPATDFTLESGWTNRLFYIKSNEFKSRNRFVVTFKKGLPAKNGLTLKQDFRQAIIMPDLDSEVSLPAAGNYLTALNNGLVPIELLNVKKLKLDLWRLYENNIPYAVKGEYNDFPKDLAQRVFTNEIDLTSLPLNERVKRAIPISEIASGERGLFLLTARDYEKSYWDEAEQILNLSNIGVTARVWEDGILIWANYLTESRAVRDANVKIFSAANQLLASGQTNIGGIFYYENNREWDINSQPAIAVISKTDENNVTDLTYIQLNRNLLNRETFDTAGRPWIRSGYDATIISPRDIYRTGEKASFKAFVRNKDIETPAAFPVIFIVRDTLNRKVKQDSVELNNFGSAVFELDLPNNALTGLWKISLAVPGKESEPIATYSFHVEDFAPPRIDVTVTSDKEFLTAGDDFNIDIYARWLFGADAAGLPYRVTWSARAADFEPTNPKLKGYTFGDSSKSFKSANGEVYISDSNLDANGKARVKIPVDEQDEDEEPWEISTYVNITARSEIMEDSGRWDSGSITRKYFPSEFLLGIAPASSAKLSVRNNINFNIAAITPNEEPADPGTLNAEFFRVTWNYNLVQVDGHKRWQSTEELNKISEKEITLKDGFGSVAFRPEQYGTYLVRISDADETTSSVYRFFADDPQYASGSQLIDRLEITSDKDSYKPGDIAKIKIKTPFEGMLMLNIESAKLIDRRIHNVSEPEKEFEVEITPEFLPNAWVTAWLIRPVQLDDAKAWGSHRAIGLAKLKMDLSDYKLNVELKAATQTEPAKKLPVTIKLTNSNGEIQPKADVAIALVDDAVLKLTNYQTPDLLKHFWGEKELNSKGYDIYDQLIPVEDRATEALHPAGDEAMAALAGDSNVQRFKILSLFQGTLTPNKRGEFTTELDIPEFSGRGRLFAIAASGKNFGTSEQQVQIARDIVAEISLPRFAAPDDEFSVPVTVFNTSDKTRNIELTFIAEGLSPKNTQAKFSLEANTSKKLSAKLKALNVDNAKLRVITSWDDNSGFEQEIDLPIRSALPAITLSGSGLFENGVTKINLPIDDFTGKIYGSITLANTPTVNINQAVEYLTRYPYGCLEQTISTAFPFLVMPDIISALDPDLLNDEALKSRINSAIIRIQSMQLYDGSFAMWQGQSKTYEWGSVYAAHFLLKAKSVGINFPEEMLTGVLNYIKQYLASMPIYDSLDDERDDLTTKAYAAYVLALNGDKPLGWLEYLNENSANMLPSGKIWLAGAQSVIDGKSYALRNLTNDSSLGAGISNAWRTLESDARNTAILLSLWLDVEPDSGAALELVNRLVKFGEDGEWHSTQDNAWVLMSLARFGVEVGVTKGEVKAKLLSGAKTLLEYSGAKTAKLDASEISNSELTIESTGTGTGYYSWTLTGTPRTQPKPEIKGLNIECSYYDNSGNIIDLRKPVAQGTIIRAILTIKPSVSISNLALNYLLPAGFELDNPRLDDGEDQTSSNGIVNDVRDDRLVIFFDRLTRETAYGFRLRAVSKGTFAVPQISAFGMYDSSVRFTGKSQHELVIK